MTTTPPPTGDYVDVEAYSWWGGDPKKTWLNVYCPFNKYSMNERTAPKAEALVWNRARDKQPVHLIVRIRRGQGVVEGLYVNDTPIEDYLKRDAGEVAP